MTVDDAGNPYSDGTITYQWLFNKTSTLPVQAEIFTNHSLFVRRLTSLDLGIYQCRAQWNNTVVMTSRQAVVIEACKCPAAHIVYLDGIGINVFLTN
jgi:hypothetical protein